MSAIGPMRDALSTKAKRRGAFRELRSRLVSEDPIETVSMCRLVLNQSAEEAGGKGRRLSDPRDNGMWIASASLNAIVAALRDAESALRREVRS